MKEDEHLPVFGIGPFLVFPILLISIISLILSFYNMNPLLKVQGMNFSFTILGTILILLGIIICFLL